MNEPVEPCLCCGNDSHIYVAEKNGFDHFQCLECKHVSVYPMPSEKQLSEFYSNSFEYVKEFAPSKVVTTDRRTKYILRYFGSRIRSITALDIGCANGDFLGAMKNLGVNKLYGIEPNSTLAGNARSRGFKIEEEMFSERSFENTTRFDLINLGDVLEHVTNPKDVLAWISSLLAPNGILTLSTPNIDNFFSKKTFLLYSHFQIPWSSLDPPAHINLFNDYSFLCLASKVKLTVIANWTHSVPLNYELGHTHLFRQFRQEKSLNNFSKWIIGWSLYTGIYYLNKAIRLISKKDTGMLYVLKTAEK